MDMKPLALQIHSFVSLYAEILICIAAATLLGWIVGLMMQRSRHKQLLKDVNTKWDERYRSLEESARDDAENLEEQLQSLANETKSSQATNRALTETLKKNDTNIQKSRAEAIELNRQHTESHERLQRIIQQKDREIAELGNRLNLDAKFDRSPDSTSIAPAIASSTRYAEIAEADLNNADTVAISPAQFSAEVMDATVQMNIPSTADAASKKTAPVVTDADASLDDTSDLSDLALEESTIAMDDEALAFAQRSYKGRGNT